DERTFPGVDAVAAGNRVVDVESDGEEGEEPDGDEVGKQEQPRHAPGADRALDGTHHRLGQVPKETTDVTERALRRLHHCPDIPFANEAGARCPGFAVISADVTCRPSRWRG